MTLLELVEEAANVLAWRGWWEPGDDDASVPDWLVAELTEIAQRPCEVCVTEAGWCRHPDEVADHFLARRQEEWERSWPTWECMCGRVFKVLAGAEEFYDLADDGLVGDHVGRIRRDSKGRVKHSDVCPGCGRVFAETIAEQTRPQQAFF
jgi:hypothetical protein